MAACATCFCTNKNDVLLHISQVMYFDECYAHQYMGKVGNR
jgi:hypothetical protein